ncbi:unnamed protein product, partial [Staurois parvus]
HFHLRLSITGSRTVITRWHPVIAEYLQQGGELFVHKTILLPVSLCTLLWMLPQCDYSEAPTHRPLVKHSQHTVNPLITPDVNPFMPSSISTVSVLFISTDHCIGVTGDVSDTK